MVKKVILLALILTGFGLLVWYDNSNNNSSDDQSASVLEGSQTGQKEEQNQENNNQEIPSYQDLPNYINDKGEFVLGYEEAPVTIIEYSSHFCGHCVSFHEETRPLLIEDYIKTGKVKLISRFLSPVTVSVSILCAQEQGGYVSYNQYLFDHASEIRAVEDLKGIAQKIGLNQDRFSACLEDSAYQSLAQSWYVQADENGVSGTPTFFVGEEKLVGNQPYEKFKRAIEEKLSL